MLVTRPVCFEPIGNFASTIPRVGQQLLHAEADALGVLVDLDDLDLHGLADIQDLGRVVDPAPGHVGDVQQAVDATEIDERAVVGDVLHDAIDHLPSVRGRRSRHAARRGTLRERRGATRRCCRGGDPSSGSGTAGSHQRARVADRAHIDLGARQEGTAPPRIDGEATLHAAEDLALDALFVGGGLLQAVQASSRRAFHG